MASARGRSRFIIAAGGTGGHILPGVAIGREMQHRLDDLAVEYLCGARPIERRIYDSQSIRPRVLPIPASFSARPGSVASLAVATAQCLASFIAHRPAGVLGMGGAVCFPVLTAARILRVPIFLHESNRIPGRVVRMFRTAARGVFLGMGGLEGDNVEITGTPVRAHEAGHGERDTIVCVGGSQGAAQLNTIFLEACRRIGERPGLRMILIAGPGKQVDAPSFVEVREYEPDMPTLLARTRLIVSRSGAGSLADIASHGIASVLVPYPHAMDNHQLANARYFEENGAAIVREERDLSGEVLAGVMTHLLDNAAALQVLAAAAARLATPDAAERIVHLIAAKLARRTPITLNRQVSHESR